MAIHHVTKAFSTGQWKGERAFVVGGGPSLRGFHFDRLKGEHVVAVNRAYEVVPWADVLFTMDSRFLTWYRDRLGPFAGHLVYHHDSGRDLKPRLQESLKRDVYTVGRLGERQLGQTLQRGIGDGANSGYGALALAWVLGARPIYLLGFDLNPSPDGLQEWFHNGYPRNDASPYTRFRRNFEWLAAQVPEGEVLNASLDSSIRGFPKVTEWPGTPDLAPWPLFVTYWTDDYYQALLERLRTSCVALGLDLEAYPVKDRGSWVANCAAKPEVILAALDSHPGRDVVFLDADAEMVKSPFIFRGTDADMAAHVRDGSELLSGTLFFRNNDRARALIHRWIALGKARPEVWDQRTLQAALREAVDAGLVFLELPPEYTFIFDSMARAHPDVEPVILHHQASRQVKVAEQNGGRLGKRQVSREGRGNGGAGQGAEAGPGHVPKAGSQAPAERTLPVRVREEVQAMLPRHGRHVLPASKPMRTVHGVRIPTPSAKKMDGYATHQPVVAFAAALALERWPDLPWAELGCGWYSTPTLAAIGGQHRLTVHSADPEWSRKFADLVDVQDVPAWPDFHLVDDHGFVLLDNEQLVVDRIKLLPRLLARSRIVVMHDWREDLPEDILGASSWFVYGHCGRPWTLLASSHLPNLEELVAGRLSL